MRPRRTVLTSTARPPLSYAVAALAAAAHLASLASLAPAAAAADEKTAAARPRPTAKADPTKRVWWNQERMVASLGLSPTQRDEMNAQLLARLEERRGHARHYAELRREMGEALAAGNWVEAQAKANEANHTMSLVGAAESALTIDVTKLLTEAQRQRVASEHPRLLQRPWLVGGLARAGGGRGTGQGASGEPAPGAGGERRRAPARGGRSSGG